MPPLPLPAPPLLLLLPCPEVNEEGLDEEGELPVWLLLLTEVPLLGKLLLLGPAPELLLLRWMWLVESSPTQVTTAPTGR